MGIPLGVFQVFSFEELLRLCEAKPTTLKRPSPGDGVENHMYCLYPKIDFFTPQGVHVILNYFIY